MSLTEEIANLTEASDNLTQMIIDKEAIINQTLAEGMSDLPSHMHKTVYVDAQFGNDDNNGTFENPYKTIKNAVLNGPQQGFLEVCILGVEGEQYTLQPQELTIALKSALFIRGRHRTTNEVARINLSFPWYLNSDNEYEMSGFFFSDYSPNIFMTRDVNLIIQAEPTSGDFSSDYYHGIIKGNISAKPASWNIAISLSDITNNASGAMLVSSPNVIVNLMLYATSSANMAGKWVYGIAAGTLSTNTARVSTNINTL